MAKKKQFAGKETKLAKLPLTQALTNQAEEEATLSRPSPSAFGLFTPPPLTWDEVNAGGGEPLAATFLFLVRELTDLKSALQTSPSPPSGNHQIYLPDRVPQPPGLLQALRQVRQSLRDLQIFLSHP
jgi:hypothetical protein